jgi:anti-sigma factor RsiW
MDCQAARRDFLDYQRGGLDPARQRDLRAHLDGCTACARIEAQEHALTDLLEQRLPLYPASVGLKRRLAAHWPTPALRERPRPPERRWSVGPALAVAAILVVAGPLLFYYQRAAVRPSDGTAGMVAEAVNDHLRLLQSLHPLEVESGGIHQVKPWFEGRLDFAPIVAFAGDQEFPLKGGAVAYFVDRKAAALVYGRRRHAISLFVFRADGLSWPTPNLRSVGSLEAYTTAVRGFGVVLWRRGDLGYALVSDLDPRELFDLAAKIAGG